MSVKKPLKTFLLIILPVLFAPLPGALGEAPDEVRAVWIDAFGDGHRTPEQVDKLIADVSAANINTIIPQVRRRGNTFHFSDIEPRDPFVQPGFDALAYLIEQAHAQNPPIEVHAWIVVYRMMHTSDPNHPINQYPEWLTQDMSGELGSPAHDPAHPGVQEHLLNVCMELITEYDIDGLHYDYPRYLGPEWGYNPVAIERFQELYNRDDIPANRDEEFSQFRRDQITQTLRRIYLYAMDVRPDVKISAATITWSPGPTGPDDFVNTRPYNDILQDWPAWMEEGILDLNVPMAYFREHNTQQNLDFRRWNVFIKDQRYDRQALIGPAIYLNTIPNSLTQIRESREPTDNGPGADGVSLYSYRATDESWNTSDPLGADAFYNALVNPSEYDSGPPVFAEPAAVPEMPWKTNPTTGHLKGYVTEDDQTVLDGATVQISGEVERTIQTDALGFYGFVDLPPGDYLVTASWHGEEPPGVPVSVSIGEVTHRDLDLNMPLPTKGHIEGYVLNAPTDRPVDGATVSLSGPEEKATQTDARGFYRFRELQPGDYTLAASWDQSGADAPATMLSTSAGAIAHQDLYFSVGDIGGGTPGEEIILDDADDGVSFTGPDWRTSTWTGTYGENYRWTHTPDHADYEGAHSATYSPDLPAAGFYKIETWYVQGTNRAPDTPYTISDGQDEEVVAVNQQANGAQWFEIRDAIYLDPADAPFVRIENDATNNVVIADAIRWTILEPIDREFPVTVTIEGEGRVEGSPEGGTVSHGETVELQATGENGFVFSHWKGNAWGSENPLSLQVGADLKIHAVFVSAWEDWVEESFTETERANPEIIDPGADPFGHGIPNLLTFAFGLDPHQPDRTLLPEAQTGEAGAELTFRRRQENSSLDYIVEHSADLATWKSDPSRIEELAVEPNGDNTETVTVRVSELLEERLFVRLRVEQN